MEQFPLSSGETDQREEDPSPELIVYPPKYQKQEKPANAWTRSVMSLALYLLLGYFIFPGYKMLLLITAIVILHEMGHFLAMKFFRYSELGIFFIPLLGAYVSGTKREVSQQQSAIILLAGPLPGIILGIGLYLLNRQQGGIYVWDIPLSQISSLLMILNLLNLLPVYPLDGGQLLNRVFLDEESLVSKIFIIISALAMAWFAWSLYDSSGHFFYLMLLIFPLMMLFRLRTDAQFIAFEKKLEAEGVDLDTSYEEMPDKDYWKIRGLLIASQPLFKDVAPGPPYEFSHKEEKIMTTIQGLLQRTLLQDVTIPGKIFILLIWLAAFAAPWLLQMDMSFFDRMR